MKKLLSVLILAILASAACAAPDIKLEFSLKRTTFEVGETIGCDLVFTNTTSRDAAIYISSAESGSTQDYTLEVTDESGKAITGRHGVSSRSSETSSTLLAAGKSVTVNDVLNQWVALSKPGKYGVKAVWKPRVMPWPPYIVLPDTADVDKSESAAISFTIVPATEVAKDARLSVAMQKLKTAKTTADKRAAVRLLGFTLDPRAMPELVKVSRQPDIILEVESAIQQLAMIDSSPELRANVATVLLTDLEKNGPSESFAYLLSKFQVPGEKMVPILEEWMKTGNSQQKADSLGMMSNLDRACLADRLRPAVSAALSDRSPEVRSSALLVLANARFSGTIKDVMYLATSDRDKGVKQRAALTLGSYGDDKAVPTLAGLLKDSDFDLAVNAVAALEMIGTQNAESALIEFSSTKSGFVQEQAVLAIERMKAKRKK